MEIDYDSLLFLEAVIRTGSFEAAARSLNVTQSAVSQRIKQLEEKVGTILIKRGRPCIATDDGLVLCQHYEQVMLLQHELTSQFSGEGMRGETSVRLRVAVNADSLATWFPEVIERAGRELNLRLEVIPDDQEFTEDRLRSGDASAIVTSSGGSIPGCKTMPLGVMNYLAIASPGFIGTHLGEGPSLNAVTRAPSIRFDRKDNLPMQWMLAAYGTTPQLESHFVPSYEGHLACCLRGAGWAMMPSLTVDPEIEQGRLSEIVPSTPVQVPLFWQTRAQSNNTLADLSNIVSAVAAKWLDPIT